MTRPARGLAADGTIAALSRKCFAGRARDRAGYDRVTKTTTLRYVRKHKSTEEKMGSLGKRARRAAVLAAAITALGVATMQTSVAHHSFAMFDSEHQIKISGTITK